MEDYTLQNGLKLDKGVRIHLPLYHLHHNPKYFKAPEQFKPERFLGDAVNDILPHTFLPFGERPRYCIGERFAKMQTMTGLLTLLKKYRVELAADMPRDITFDPSTILTSPKGGINLKMVPREGWEGRLFTFNVPAAD
ncbi:hypothetical protein K1T71_011091 [Dendrolimus kikuchii]|uniref:Uncharacterized protein n=1 Tax=Dendrolimus kikuchii TaxID=765133 RepID=A0ACC1CN27_9NEOP|nr:hypothetical protein K1T71_011091 [Dendrolimus kikuchii]